jgi:hypothetical protein
MTDIANETENQSLGGSALNDRLGFAAHTKEHLDWVSKLKSGDDVDIVNPWFDDKLKDGRRTRTRVLAERYLTDGVTRLIHIENFGEFYASGARFNQIIMPPNA